MRRALLALHVTRWCSRRLAPLFILFPLAAWSSFRLRHGDEPYDLDRLVQVALIAAACLGTVAVYLSWALEPWRAWRRRRPTKQVVLSHVSCVGGALQIQGVTVEGLLGLWEVDRHLSAVDIKIVTLFTFLRRNSQLILVLRDEVQCIAYRAFCPSAFEAEFLEWLEDSATVIRRRSFLLASSPVKQLSVACAVAVFLGSLAVIGFLR